MKNSVKRLFLCALALLLTVAFCGCDRIVGLRGEQKSSSSSFDSRYDKTPDQGMAPYDVYSYYQNAYMAQCYLMNFCAGSGAPIVEDDTVKDGDITYARCNTNFFKTAKEFEDLLKLFFDGEFLKKLQENAGIGDPNPKYKDFNGVAYMRTDTIGDEMSFKMDSNTFEIVENTVDCIKYTVNGKYTYGDATIDAQHRIILDKINGSWRTTYWMIDDLAQSSSSSASSEATSSSAN